MFTNQISSFLKAQLLRARTAFGYGCPLCCLFTSLCKDPSPCWNQFFTWIPISVETGSVKPIHRLLWLGSMVLMSTLNGFDVPWRHWKTYSVEPQMSESVIFCGIVAIEECGHRVRMSDAMAIEGLSWLLRGKHPLHSLVKISFLLQLSNHTDQLLQDLESCTILVIKHFGHTYPIYACVFMYKFCVCAKILIYLY